MSETLDIRTMSRVLDDGCVLVMMYARSTGEFAAEVIGEDGDVTDEFDADGFAFAFGTGNLVRAIRVLSAA